MYNLHMSLQRRIPSLLALVDLARHFPHSRLSLFRPLFLLLVLVWIAWFLWVYQTSSYHLDYLVVRLRALSMGNNNLCVLLRGGDHKVYR